MPQKIKDKIGLRYGLLIVIELYSQSWDNRIFWLCKCDCGKETIVRGDALQSGNTKSCGCLNKEIRAIKQTGKNNLHYVNGKFTKAIFKLKEKIRKRDDYICQECGKTQEQNLKEIGRILSVHHIDGDDTNNIEENMISFCNVCHQKIERKISEDKSG